MRRIAAATILCLVMSLALFTTGAFAQSAHTSASANTAVAAESAQFFPGFFGGGLFGGGFSSGFFGLSVTSVFNFNTFIPFGGGCFSFC